MSSNPQIQNLENWLRRALTPSTKIKDPIRELKLRHISGERGAAECANYPFEVGSEVNIEDLAATIYQDAINDAENLPGPVQNYAIQAFYGESETPKSRTTFRVQGANELEDTGDITASEQPTEKGMAAQAMRHTEFYAKMAMGSMDKVLAHQGRIIDRLSTQLERRDELHFKTIEAAEELMNLKAGREMNAMKEVKAQQRKDMMFGKVMQVAGQVLPRLMAGPAPTVPAPSVEEAPKAEVARGEKSGERKSGEGKKTPRELVQEVFDSANKDVPTPVSDEAQIATLRFLISLIKDEQIPDVMAVLTQDQVGLFAALYKVNQAALEAAAAAKEVKSPVDPQAAAE